MKTTITYASDHHQNTKKIEEVIASVISAEVVDITKEKNISLVNYDVIGFASGIYFNTFHKDLIKYLKETNFSKNQRAFLVYTCGLACRDYSKEIREILNQKNIPRIDTFCCRGWDTFSFLKIIGGIAKGHPNDNDFKKARQFALKNLGSGLDS